MKRRIAFALAFYATAAEANEPLSTCPEVCRPNPQSPYDLICIKQDRIVQLLKRSQPGDSERIQELQNEIRLYLASDKPRTDANPKECKIPTPVPK